MKEKQHKPFRNTNVKAHDWYEKKIIELQNKKKKKYLKNEKNWIHEKFYSNFENPNNKINT